MAVQQHPGCLARLGQWLVYLLAGLLIGAILAGLIHAWNPTFGILPAAYSLTPRAVVPPAADLPVIALPPAVPAPTATVDATAIVTAAATLTTSAPVSETVNLSPEEEQFLAQAQTLFVTYVGLLETISQRLMTALESPDAANDAAWREQTSAQVAEMRAVASEVRALIAPMRYATAWDEMRIATVFFDRSLDALTAAVATRAADQIQTARINLQIAVEAVNRAAVALQTAMPADMSTQP